MADGACDCAPFSSRERGEAVVRGRARQRAYEEASVRCYQCQTKSMCRRHACMHAYYTIRTIILRGRLGDVLHSPPAICSMRAIDRTISAAKLYDSARRPIARQRRGHQTCLARHTRLFRHTMERSTHPHQAQAAVPELINERKQTGVPVPEWSSPCSFWQAHRTIRPHQVDQGWVCGRQADQEATPPRLRAERVDCALSCRYACRVFPVTGRRSRPSCLPASSSWCD